MRKIMTIAAILLAFSFSFAEDGFSLYVNKDYQGAYNAFYKQFTENSNEPLYAYNLGVASEALGKKGEAFYFYLQALQNAPDFAEAKNNLDILSKELSVTIPKSLTEPLFAVDTILVIFFVSFYLFAILLSFLCFKKDWRIKLALLPIFLVMCVSASFYCVNYNENMKDNWAVAVKNDALRSGPDSSLTEIGQTKEGEIVTVVSSSGSWYKVKSFQDNVEGWIELGSIRAIRRGYL